jgi:hypothetical protein
MAMAMPTMIIFSALGLSSLQIRLFYGRWVKRVTCQSMEQIILKLEYQQAKRGKHNILQC